jgi:hypothetical protein
MAGLSLPPSRAARRLGSNHVPAKQTKTSYYEEFEAMFGPKPLPPHFGEIDIAAPFNAHRFYTMLRCTGANPYVWRHNGEKTVWYCQHMHDLSKINTRRFYEAHAWANAQDKDSSIRKSFNREIVKSKADGHFIHYLGC